MKMISDSEFYSWRTTKGWRTRRAGKPEQPVCPGCGEPLTDGALSHMKRRHVDLYQRRARKYGDLT